MFQNLFITLHLFAFKIQLKSRHFFPLRPKLKKQTISTACHVNNHFQNTLDCEQFWVREKEIFPIICIILLFARCTWLLGKKGDRKKKTEVSKVLSKDSRLYLNISWITRIVHAYVFPTKSISKALYKLIGHVVVQFYPWFNAYFLSLWVWYSIRMNLKQIEVKFKPRPKLNHNIHPHNPYTLWHAPLSFPDPL